MTASPELGETFEKPHDFRDAVDYHFRTMRSFKSALSTVETMV